LIEKRKRVRRLGDTPHVVSERYVELSRCFVAALNARDIDAMLAVCDPSIELHSAIGAIEGVYQGHEGVRRWRRDNVNVWGEEISIEPEALFDLGQHMLLFYVARGRGLSSGAEVAMHGAAVAKWRDGLMTYLKGYRDRENTLRDLAVTDAELQPIAP
jgi:hypothetical protein